MRLGTVPKISTGNRPHRKAVNLQTSGDICFRSYSRYKNGNLESPQLQVAQFVTVIRTSIVLLSVKQMNAGAVVLTDCVFWFIIVPFLAINNYNLSVVSTANTEILPTF